MQGLFVRRQIRNQNHFAAVIIQRCFRGYICRKRLWSYGGEWYVYNVIKVQCAVRTRLALKVVVRKWQEKVARSVHKIHSLFYYWKARTLRHKIHAAFMKKCVIKLQSAYRRKIAKRLFYIVKTIHRNKMALRLQCCIRKFIGYRRALHRKRLKEYLLHHFVVQKLKGQENKMIMSFISHEQQQQQQQQQIEDQSGGQGLQRTSSIVSIITANTTSSAFQHEPVINFRHHSSSEAIIRFSSILYDLAIKAEFTKAYHKSQQIITHEYVKRNIEDLASNSILNRKPMKRLSAMSALSSVDMESTTSPTMDHDAIGAFLQSLSIPEHLKRFLIEYLIYLPHATNWSKYGRTRQLHTSLLERWMGYLSQKIMRSADQEIFEEASENTRKKKKDLLAQAKATSAEGQPVDEHGIPTMIEIGGTVAGPASSTKGKEVPLTVGESKSTKNPGAANGSIVGSVKSTMTNNVLPFSSKQPAIVRNSATKEAVVTEKMTLSNRNDAKKLSPWNVETIKVMQRKDSMNTINTLSRHPSEASIRSSSSKGSTTDAESLSKVFHPKNRKDNKNPPVGIINSTFAALKEKDQYLESKRHTVNNAVSLPGALSKGTSMRSRTATMETIEELSMDEDQGIFAEENPLNRFKIEQSVTLFPDNSIKLDNKFSIDEVIDMFFQITSLSYYSYLKSFDAYMMKIDMLLFYAFHRLSHIVNEGNLPLPVEDDNNHNGGFDHNEADWQSIEDGNDPLLAAVAEGGNRADGSHNTAKTLTEYNYFLPFFHGYEGKDKTLKKLLMRAMKLMSKAKSMVVVGSLEEFELHFRFDFFHSLNSLPIVLYEVKKEFMVKIVNVNTNDQPIDSKNNDQQNKLPPIPNNTKKNKKIGGRPKTTSADDIAITVTVRVILSGAIVYVTGVIEKFEDIVPPPVHQQTAICIRLVEYLKSLSGSKSPAAAGGSTKGNMTRSNSIISKGGSVQSLTNASSVSFLSRQSSMNSDIDNDSLASSIYEEDKIKSQFPLVIRPMVLFHQEVNQLISSFKLNYVESDDEDDEENDGAHKKYSSNKRKSNSANRRKKKQKNRKHSDSRTVEGFHQLLQRFSHLEDLGEEFIEYVVHKELNLSLVYQFHVLSNQVAMSQQAISQVDATSTAAGGTLTTGSVVSAVTAASLAASLTVAATHGSSSQPLVVADNIEPVIQFRIPSLDQKRRQLLASNDIRYATMVLQRIYRGYVGRKRFKYVYKKRQEILRRRWLAWKVLDKLRLMRQKHERMAILVQSNVKGWLWRKHLKKMNEEILNIQMLIRRVQAKKKVDAERKRRLGGPQVIDMIPAGKVIVLHDKHIQMKVYRAGGNFKFRGIDLINGEIYYGTCYQQDVKKLLQGYNEIIKCEYEGRGELITSVACKNDQIFSWQYEKIADFIVSHVDLIHNIHPITNTFFLLPGEEQDRFNRKNDLMLVVKLHVSDTIYDKLQAKYMHLLHGNKDDIMTHSFLPFLKKIIHEEGKEKRLIGNSKNRKNLIRGFNASNQQRNKNGNRKGLTVTTNATSSANNGSNSTLPLLSSSSQRNLTSATSPSSMNASLPTDLNPIAGRNTTSSSKLMMAGKFSLQGAGGSLGGIR